MTYREVAKELQLDVSENTIARALVKEGYHHTDHHKVSKNHAKKNDRERQKLVKQVDLASSQTIAGDKVVSPNAETPVDLNTSWASSPENSTASGGTQPTEPTFVDSSSQLAYNMSTDSCESRQW